MSEWIKKLTGKYSEVNENKKAALQKKLAKSAQSSEKGKAAVTLPKAPFKIPEEIAATERTAFMGAAAAAHKAGKSHFNFAGKKHKVTMQKDTAKAIADDVEEAYNEPQGQAKRMMSPLQKMRMDKEKADRDADGKLKPKMKKEEAKIDEISMSKLGRYSKAAAKDIEQKRNKVKSALDQPASVKHAKAGLKAMSGLTKRSRGSDMYVNKMTGRSKVKPTNEAAVDEVSKGMVGRYLKKVPASAAHAGDRTGTGGMGQAGASADVKKGYEKQRKKGIAQFMRRQKGTNMAVNKLTGKAKVPAREAYENIPKATHKGVQDPMGKGLSPSAKDQLAKKMPIPEPIDEPKVDAKNFKTFRKGLKQAKKRPGDK